ncbi:hypothetical protein [Salegentibacter sp.]|uniref:hypothetical protein n=1 Tax=Salegentibacter sp. TaxID=1903072 RepID=UPI0035631195
MKKIVNLIIWLLSLTSLSQELSVVEIQAEVEKINSESELVHYTFDTDKIYNQTTEAGGTFDVWVNNQKIRKISQKIFLSNGQFITTIYLKNNQPILILELEKHFQWNDDNSGLDYEKELETNYSELIYAYNWDKDPIKVVSKGNSLRNETVCGLSDYWGLLQTAMKIIP